MRAVVQPVARCFMPDGDPCSIGVHRQHQPVAGPRSGQRDAYGQQFALLRLVASGGTPCRSKATCSASLMSRGNRPRAYSGRF
jgi:hypothetical protein